MSFSTWFNDGAYESLKKTLEGIRDKTISRQDALSSLQEALNFVCSSLNSIQFATSHSIKALLLNTLAQRDTYLYKMDKDIPEEFKLELRGAPIDTPTCSQGL